MKQGLNLIIGGQAGSEAKGKLSGWLCEKYQPVNLVMTASPNAGHTVVTPDGEKKVSYHLPIGSVMCGADIFLTAPSLINLEIFEREIKTLGINPGRIYVDPRASIITSWHITAESEGRLSDIGSTLQGIGECRISKMRRRGRAHHVLAEHIRDIFEGMGVNVGYVPVAEVLVNRIRGRQLTIMEGTQGFDLDLEHGIDPRYCTSKMINPSMMMAEAGIPPHMVGDIYGVIRPYPIRVNNRTGSSGPYADAPEITWKDVAERCGFPGNVEEFGEITTTTKLPRRVFEFSWERFNRFLQVCGPTFLCLQFANYLDWSVYEMDNLTFYSEDGMLPKKVVDFVTKLRAFNGCPPVSFLGTGPGHQHMIEL